MCANFHEGRESCVRYFHIFCGLRQSWSTASRHSKPALLLNSNWTLHIATDWFTRRIVVDEGMYHRLELKLCSSWGSIWLFAGPACHLLDVSLCYRWLPNGSLPVLLTMIFVGEFSSFYHHFLVERWRSICSDGHARRKRDLSTVKIDELKCLYIASATVYNQDSLLQSFSHCDFAYSYLTERSALYVAEETIEL